MEQQSKFDCLIKGDSIHETGSFDPWIYLWGLAIQKPEFKISAVFKSFKSLFAHLPSSRVCGRLHEYRPFDSDDQRLKFPIFNGELRHRKKLD